MEENQNKIDKDDKQAYFTFYLGEADASISFLRTTAEARGEPA